MHTSDLSRLLVCPSCPSVVSVSLGGSSGTGLSGDCITLQWLESGAGFTPTILSMLGRGLGNYLHHRLHSENNCRRGNRGLCVYIAREMHMMLDMLADCILPNSKHHFIGDFIG